VLEIEQDDTGLSSYYEESKDLFINPLQVGGLKKLQSWFTNINTSGGQLYCKLNTRAEVSVLPAKVYGNLQPKPPLQPTNMKLTAYGDTSIQPKGTCHLTCTAPDSINPLSVEFYVTPVNVQTILGLTDCIALGLIKHVCPIQEC